MRSPEMTITRLLHAIRPHGTWIRQLFCKHKLEIVMFADCEEAWICRKCGYRVMAIDGDEDW